MCLCLSNCCSLCSLIGGTDRSAEEEEDVEECESAVEGQEPLSSSASTSDAICVSISSSLACALLREILVGLNAVVSAVLDSIRNVDTGGDTDVDPMALFSEESDEAGE